MSLTSIQPALSLARASARYGLTVAGAVRHELSQWASRAGEIDEGSLRVLALAKLHAEGFNAAAAAMLATLAPRAKRAETVRGIVALEVMFDYLDGRTELPVEGDPIGRRRELLAPLAAAIEGRTYEHNAPSPYGDAAYLSELARTVSNALARVGTSRAVREQMLAACERASEAQAHLHAASELGAEALEEWARRNTNGTGLQWREHLAASAASVLALHALLATGGTSEQDAARVDETYMYMAALATLLDGAIDERLDALCGAPSCASLYGDPAELQATVLALARGASERARQLDRGAEHEMLLGGVLAFYATAPGAVGLRAAVTIAALRAEHRGLIGPAAVVLRTWRAVSGRGDGL